MAKRKATPTKPGAHLRAVPAQVTQGEPLVVQGNGWPGCPVEVTLQGKPAVIARILDGHPVPAGVRATTGSFALRVSTDSLEPGECVVDARSADGTRKRVRVEIRKRARVSARDVKEDRGLARERGKAAFDARFGHIGYVPEGVIDARIRSFGGLRKPPFGDGAVLYSLPVHGACNWTPMGPAPIVAGAPALHPAVSGRIRSIAIDRVTPSTLYVGTANGGVWKSTDSGATWSPKTDDQASMAIGALAIDPNATNRIFAGTGEYHQGDPYNGYPGAGLLYSDNSGDTWTRLGAGTFDRVEMTRILFDPNNSANHMFLSCDAGVYESTTGGSGWTQLRAGSASDLVMIVSGMPPVIRLIAAFFGEGLFTNTLSGGVWSGWTPLSSPAFPATFERVVLGQSKNNPQTIWAAFSDGAGLAAVCKTINGGTMWTAVGLPTGPIWGTSYNLHLAVHPDTPDTVFLGTNKLSRTDTGAAPWSDVGAPPTLLHSDHHAFAFDPVTPSVVYACNDGGVYRSSDGGTSWQHRNTDLGTVQLYHVANHPQWAALALGGTQDNGGAFYTGAPAWKLNQWPGLSHNTLGGDVVSTAFDAVDPSRMYYVGYYEVRRSDDGGRFWTLKYTVPSPAEWATPFIADPVLGGVCYTAGNVLYRSSNWGDSWTPATGALTGNVTTIARHPMNADMVYVGTSQGRVYRVQRTGADWTVPNVTTTDLTAPPLPAGLYVSCVAVDRAGTVWVSFSAILATELPGEFTNDHVYALPAGSTTWVNRSAGLAQANPINTIAIDPTDDTVVFCGGDTSVFRWSGASWTLWDQGLPNAPVLHLSVHQPSRLLRAATYGRGLWERPIDAVFCSDVDIYMRDNILDSGRGPAPSGVPHPFDSASLVWWWQSEDIVVDAPPFATTSPVTDHVTLANEIVHENARRGQTNRFYVQVHNRGPFKATNVRVRAFFANASAVLPTLPGDFWSGMNPFDGDPTAVDWAPIGPTQPAGDIEPGDTAIVSWDWPVPPAAAEHSCLLALATCTEDSLNAMGVLDPGQLINDNNNVTLKNLTIV